MTCDLDLFNNKKTMLTIAYDFKYFQNKKIFTIYLIWYDEGTVRGAPSDIVTFQGRHLFISLHLKGDIFWYSYIWGKLFLAERFLIRDGKIWWNLS